MTRPEVRITSLMGHVLWMAESVLVSEEQLNYVRQIMQRGKYFDSGRQGHIAKYCRSAKRRPGQPWAPRRNQLGATVQPNGAGPGARGPRTTPGQTGGGGGRVETRTCHRCKRPGHLIANCPNPPAQINQSQEQTTPTTAPPPGLKTTTLVLSFMIEEIKSDHNDDDHLRPTTTTQTTDPTTPPPRAVYHNNTYLASTDYRGPIVSEIRRAC